MKIETTTHGAHAVHGWLMCALAGAVSVATPAIADPPGRVGRLSMIEGAVSFRPASDTVWAPAQPNRPITTGDRVWADTSSRAEVEVGSAAFRVGSQTEVDVVRIDDHAIQLRVPQGTVHVRVRTLEGGDDDEIDTPNAAAAFGADGSYRVDVSPDGATTTVIVRSGSAEVTAAGSSFAVQAGQAATVQGDNAPTYQVAAAPPPDAFDQWTSDRDERVDRAIAASSRYVPPDMPGVADLDDDGRWEVDQTYGPVWYPTVVATEWAPYHSGHWVWEGPWGWTWVDDEPWGFAPFHYGRWAHFGGRWGWCPGRVVILHPVFAPALVAFVGGPGWGVEFGLGPDGGIGWFPLAPEEIYYPPYARTVEYVRRVNITNVTNVTNITNIRNVTNVTNVTNVNYRNRSVAGAMTVVPQREFVAGHPVARAAVRVPQTALTSAPMIGHALPVKPTREAILGAPVVKQFVPTPPVHLATRPVLANHAPLPAALHTGPLPIHSARVAILGGHPLTSSATTVTTTTPVVPHPLTPAVPPRVVAQPPSHPAGGPGTVPLLATHKSTTPLDLSYQAHLSQMEARHYQEFAHPPKGETVKVQATRQQAEHVQLETQYHAAQVAGAKALPPTPRTPPVPPHVSARKPR